MVESGCPGGSDELLALAIRTRMIYLCGQDKQEPDMVEAAFNTIAEIQRLRDAGFEQKQAEAITLSIHAGVTGGVATKADVDLVRTELDGKIDLLRADVVSSEKALRSEIDALRADVVTGDNAIRTDINLVKTELDGKIDALRKDVVSGDKTLKSEIDLLRKELEKTEERLDGKIEKAKFDLTWRLLAGIAAFNAIIFALMRYLPPPATG